MTFLHWSDLLWIACSFMKSRRKVCKKRFNLITSIGSFDHRDDWLIFCLISSRNEKLQPKEIQKKLRAESPIIIRRILELYHRFISKYLETDVLNFAPKECIVLKLRSKVLLSAILYSDFWRPDYVRVEEGHSELVKDDQLLWKLKLKKLQKVKKEKRN